MVSPLVSDLVICICSPGKTVFLGTDNGCYNDGRLTIIRTHSVARGIFIPTSSTKKYAFIRSTITICSDAIITEKVMRLLTTISRFSALIIVFIAICTRLYKLDQVPSGFHDDEASFFINSIALKHTEADEDGRKWPLFLQSIVDPKPALFSYIQIPFLFVFGETVFAARLTSSFLGIISLLLFDILLTRLKIGRNTRLLILLFCSLSPWHIVLSRSTHEVILSLVFCLLGLILLSDILLYKKRTLLYYLGLFIVYLLASYSYHSAKIILPLLSMSFIFIHAFNKSIKEWKLCFALIALTTLPTLILLANPASWNRYQSINIFSETGPLAILSDQIAVGTGHAPAFLLRALHNKVVNYGLAFASNYFHHFTADYFIFSGGQPDRYVIPNQGLLYHGELLLLLLGIMYAFRYDFSPVNKYMLTWIVIPPLIPALTFLEIPSMIRPAIMIFPIYYFIGLSVSRIIHFFGKQRALFLTGYVLLYCFEITYFWHQYSVQQTYSKPWFRNWADQQLTKYIKTVSSEYKSFYIGKASGRPYLHFVTAGLIPIRDIQMSYPMRLDSNPYWDKFHFVDEKCPYGTQDKTMYFVYAYCDVPEGYQRFIHQRIPYADGNQGYLAVTYTRNSE